MEKYCYKIDETNRLMDDQGNYILGDSGNPILLSDLQIDKIKSSKLIEFVDK